MSPIAIREFQLGDEEAFFELNREWIQGSFWLEPTDLEVLWNPKEKILDQGGRILLAVRERARIGCCALLKMDDGCYELAKMAVTPAERRNGVGRRLMAAAIELAEEIGATRLYLETNHTLTGAIALYESMGFRHLPAKSSHYQRADVFMERWLKPAQQDAREASGAIPTGCGA